MVQPFLNFGAFKNSRCNHENQTVFTTNNKESLPGMYQLSLKRFFSWDV